MGRSTPGSSDAELVAAIRRGDTAAADDLVRRHFRAAFAVALAQLGNSMDAEDVCQDAFVRALEKIDHCRRPERFVFWLLRIVRNRAHNARDYRRVRAGPPLDTVDAAAPEDSSRGAARSELRSALEAVLATLTPVQREVMLLKHLEGWDHRTIARSMGISEGMSRQHAFTARRALQEHLGAAQMKDYFDD